MNPDVVIETFSGSSAVAHLHSSASAIRAVGGRRLDRSVDQNDNRKLTGRASCSSNCIAPRRRHDSRAICPPDTWNLCPTTRRLFVIKCDRYKTYSTAKSLIFAYARPFLSTIKYRLRSQTTGGVSEIENFFSFEYFTRLRLCGMAKIL